MGKVISSDEILDAITKLVELAEEEVLVSSAWITPQGIKTVLESVREGVRVKIILRANEPRDLQITKNEVFEVLRSFREKVEISVAFHSNLHAKFIVIDDKYALVGSANITSSGLLPRRGNIETAVLLDEKEEVKKLRDYFYKIWNDEVATGRIFVLDNDIVGFISNPSRSNSVEILLTADSKVFEGSFLVFHEDGRKYLARVKRVMGWNMGFFLNPFTQENGSVLFPPPQDFKLIFDGQKVREWQIASLIAYLNQKDSNVYIATAEVLGYIDQGELKPSLTPPKVGIPVKRARKEDLHALLPKGTNVPVGVFVNTDIEAYINLDEVRARHLAVLGTTGSGKSYFTKKFIMRASDYLNHIYVLDPHGEYARDFRTFGFQDFIEVTVPNTILFFSPDKVEGFLKTYGFTINKRSSEGARVYSRISKWARNVALGQVSKGLFEEIRLPPEVEELLRQEFGDGALTNQGSVIQTVNATIVNPPKRVVVFNLRDIDSPEVRTEVAGYILRNLFIKAKNCGEFNGLVVLEEAHNFAPERGYGDTTAGRDNLAKVYTQKIASEGRKFGIGLVIISQRPAQVSKYVLSQTNTQVLFRIINKSDLDAVASSIESTSRHIIDRLPDLKTGYAFIAGAGTPVPAIIEIR